MGYRLSKITTRTGDQGDTGLGDGSRVSKCDLRIEAGGEVDELNCCIGLLLTEAVPAELKHPLRDIQHRLFDLGGELSIPGYSLLKPEHIAALEKELASLNRELPPLQEFILPGGSRAAAVCHLARAVCRRAERRCAALAQREPASAQALAYLNRLSDFLFILARTLSRMEGGNEVLWRRKQE